MNVVNHPQTVAACQAQFDSLTSLAGILLGGSEEINAAVFKAMRECLDRFSSLRHSLQDVGDAGESGGSPLAMLPPLLDSGWTLTQECQRIATCRSQDLARFWEAQIGRLSESMQASMEFADTRSAANLMALKEAMTAMNDAYASMSAAGRQAADSIAEHSLMMAAPAAAADSSSAKPSPAKTSAASRSRKNTEASA